MGRGRIRMRTWRRGKRIKRFKSPLLPPHHRIRYGTPRVVERGIYHEGTGGGDGAGVKGGAVLFVVDGGADSFHSEGIS